MEDPVGAALPCGVAPAVPKMDFYELVLLDLYRMGFSFRLPFLNVDEHLAYFEKLATAEDDVEISTLWAAEPSDDPLARRDQIRCISVHPNRPTRWLILLTHPDEPDGLLAHKLFTQLARNPNSKFGRMLERLGIGIDFVVMQHERMQLNTWQNHDTRNFVSWVYRYINSWHRGLDADDNGEWSASADGTTPSPEELAAIEYAKHAVVEGKDVLELSHFHGTPFWNGGSVISSRPGGTYFTDELTSVRRVIIPPALGPPNDSAYAPRISGGVDGTYQLPKLVPGLEDYTNLGEVVRRYYPQAHSKFSEIPIGLPVGWIHMPGDSAQSLARRREIQAELGDLLNTARDLATRRVEDHRFTEDRDRNLRVGQAAKIGKIASPYMYNTDSFGEGWHAYSQIFASALYLARRTAPAIAIAELDDPRLAIDLRLGAASAIDHLRTGAKGHRLLAPAHRALGHMSVAFDGLFTALFERGLAQPEFPAGSVATTAYELLGNDCQATYEPRERSLDFARAPSI